MDATEDIHYPKQNYLHFKTDSKNNYNSNYYLLNMIQKFLFENYAQTIFQIVWA